MKLAVAEPGDSFEVKVAGKVADILRPSGEIVEIQTKAFTRLKAKLEAFCPAHSVRIVYPLIEEKTIINLDPEDGSILSRRKSQKRGRIEDVFEEFVHFPDLLAYPGLRLDIYGVKVDEIRIRDGRGSWRRQGVSIHDRRLLDRRILVSLERPRDILRLIPAPLPPEFTSADVARIMDRTRRFGTMVCYVLARAGLSESIGKKGRALNYRLKKKPRGKSRT